MLLLLPPLSSLPGLTATLCCSPTTNVQSPGRGLVTERSNRASCWRFIASWYRAIIWAAHGSLPVAVIARQSPKHTRAQRDPGMGQNFGIHNAVGLCLSATRKGQTSGQAPIGQISPEAGGPAAGHRTAPQAQRRPSQVQVESSSRECSSRSCRAVLAQPVVAAENAEARGAGARRCVSASAFPISPGPIGARLE